MVEIDGDEDTEDAEELYLIWRVWRNTPVGVI